jgi:N-methylhydantoinase B
MNANAQGDPDIDPDIWDGVTQSYRPRADWRTNVSEVLSIHDDATDDVDPVTYEVIRHRLWTINMSHGETVTRVSGSPVFAALDFNMCVLSETAEVVMNAPFIQWLDAGAPLAIRYVMERLSEDPGIEDGDIFLGNDPWIGAAHQMDVLIACPVFVDDKLFAWVSSAGHQYDLGGIVPGGWPQNAVDVYSDPIVLPPFKLVSRGTMRPDLERLYLRQSRMPGLVALDLRAQLAGARFARDQLVSLCEQFGAPTVKGVMRGILDRTQRSFRQKLLTIPDGTWSEVRYVDEKLPGDRHSYRLQVNLTKRGDQLTVDNKGTDEQTDGPIGFTFAGFAGAVVGSLATSMLYEQLFALGGADRQINYRPTPGLLSCVAYPAAVSAGVTSISTHTGAVQTALARMMASSPELKDDVIAASPDFAGWILVGEDSEGKPFGQGLMDNMAVGSGARSTHDGVDTSGPSWNPLSILLNIEQVEQWYPLIYLYRHELCDSGGAGRWRGGAGMAFAITPLRARTMQVITVACGMAISTYGAEGVFGGYPSPTGRTVVRRGTNLRDWITRRSMPASVHSLEAEETIFLPGKSNGTALADGDVVEMVFVGGGGYGDPLQRESWRVARDVDRGYVSRAAAERVYGVRIGEGDEVDETATAELRGRLIRARLRWEAATPSSEATHKIAASGEAPRMVHESVVARDDGEVRVLACVQCETALAGYDGNYKAGALCNLGAVTDIPAAADPRRFLDEDIVFRSYCCPGCGTLLSTEIARRSEPVLSEFALFVDDT